MFCLRDRQRGAVRPVSLTLALSLASRLSSYSFSSRFDTTTRTMNTYSRIQLIAAAMVILNTKLKKKKRNYWIRKKLLMSRKLPRILSAPIEDPEDFRNFLRVDSKLFKELLRLVTPLIQKNGSVMRSSISPKRRLAATLTFLATGCSSQELMSKTLIPAQLLDKIIPETCDAIFKCLKKYIQMCQTTEEWENTARLFEEQWNFPHCLGVFDGRHIAITHPIREKNDGILFLNYKEFYSVVLLAVFNAKYEFLYCEVGFYGRWDADDILQSSSLYDRLEENKCNLPEPRPLPHSEVTAPFVFLGSTSFSVDPHLMTPPRGELSKEEKICNYRISRAVRVAENAFGIFSARFGMYRKPLCFKRVEKMVLASCALHNFLIKRAPGYLKKNMFDRENVKSRTFHRGDWRKKTEGLVPLELSSLDYNEEAITLRERFTKYLNAEGRASFQEHMLDVVPLTLERDDDFF